MVKSVFICPGCSKRVGCRPICDECSDKYRDLHLRLIQSRCSLCHGAGFFTGDTPCPRCEGTGRYGKLGGILGESN